MVNIIIAFGLECYNEQMITRRIILLCLLLLAFVCNWPSVAAQKVQPAITQYSLVEVGQYGPLFRTKMAPVLRNMGFTVKEYKRPAYSEDEMESYVMLRANRVSRTGRTTVVLESGEDMSCTVNFGSKAELDAFVKSMADSGYKRSGTFYSHPKNKAGFGQIYVRVKRNSVHIICPFEMLPSDF